MSQQQSPPANSRLHPFLWGALVLLLAQALTLFLAHQEMLFLQENPVPLPEATLGPAVIFFFGAVVVFGIVLFLIPLRWLRLVLRALFAVIFGWGIFIMTALVAPLPVPYLLAVAASILWVLWTKIWLHDLLLLIALSAAGAVFGFLFSPWVFMAFMLIISVYDVVAVRLGFMLWMAEKLSDSDALPGFVLPRQAGLWNLNLREARISTLSKEDPSARDFAVLGGGDIAFPLMLAVAVFFDTGLTGALVVSFFALAGLMGAFLIQALWLKGKPIPALPPIAGGSLLGLALAALIF